MFDGKAVALEGRGDGHWCLITCGRDVGRNGRVSGGDFQFNSGQIIKEIGRTHQPGEQLALFFFLTARLLLWKDTAAVVGV